MEKLQAGERAAIFLAESVKANIVIIDEKAARLIAAQRGLSVTGILGVLGEAGTRKVVNLADAIRPAPANHVSVFSRAFQGDTGTIRHALLLVSIARSNPTAFQAVRIGFPEIDSGAEPVIFIVARTEWSSLEQALAYSAVAAVVAQNESGREAMQFLPVVSGDLSRFGVDALGDEGLNSRLPGFISPQCEFLCGFPELLKRRPAAEIERSVG